MNIQLENLKKEVKESGTEATFNEMIAEIFQL